MKILVFSQYYEPEPFLIHDKCKGLIDRGHDVTVITGLPNYPDGKILDNYNPGITILDGVKIVRLNIVPRKTGAKNLFLNYLSYVREANEYVKTLDHSYDVIYVYQLSPVMMALPAVKYKKKYKKPLIIYCLDLWPESLVSGGIKKGSLIYLVFKKLSKYIYRHADNIHVSSRLFPKYFNDVLNVKKKFVYNPQYANENTNTEISEQSFFDKNKINITFTGNIGEMQDLETALNAMSLIENKEVVLNIIGDGSKLEDLKLLTKNLNITDNVVFHGRQPSSLMNSYMNQSDALLITMKDDEMISYTLPAKVQSYLQSGKYILGAINGEASYVINASKAGMTCSAGDAKQLASNIEYFIAHQERLKDKGLNGPQYYQANFGKNQFIDILLKDMERLVR